MKRKRLLKMTLVIFLAGLIVFPVFAGTPGVIQNEGDLYWLSYIENGKGVFLMQIDSTGKVLRAPVFMDAGPAISHNGANKINLWGAQRVVIDEKTLSIVKKVKNTIIGSLESVTNKTQKNFAAVVGEEDLSLSFFGVSPTGVPNGAKWEIASSQDQSACDYVICPFGVVSSDGKAIFWIIRGFIFTSPGLYIQPLLDTGRPDGFERLVSQDVDPIRGAISNVLPGGKIYLVYLLPGNDGLPRQLILQAVDAQKGQRIGDKILLKETRFGLPYVAVDPFGRFVIYTHKNGQNVHFLSFLALDATGHPSGTSKVLVRKVDAYDFHLLKD